MTQDTSPITLGHLTIQQAYETGFDDAGEDPKREWPTLNFRFAYRCGVRDARRQQARNQDFQSSEYDGISLERKSLPPLKRSEQVSQELDAARAAHHNHVERFGDYDGNNPKKFQTQIRSAAQEVARLEGLLRYLQEQGE